MTTFTRKYDQSVAVPKGQNKTQVWNSVLFRLSAKGYLFSQMITELLLVARDLNSSLNQMKEYRRGKGHLEMSKSMILTFANNAG